MAAAGTLGALSTLPYVLPAATAAIVGMLLAIIILILICSCCAGAADVGVSMLVAQNSCLGPFFCTSVSGRQEIYFGPSLNTNSFGRKMRIYLVYANSMSCLSTSLDMKPN